MPDITFLNSTLALAHPDMVQKCLQIAARWEKRSASVVMDPTTPEGFTEWIMYLAPIGDKRADYAVGVIQRTPGSEVESHS